MPSDIVINGLSKPVTEFPAKRSNGSNLQLPDDKIVDCASNGKDIKFGVEPILGKHINRNRTDDVDVKKCKTPGDNGLIEVKDENMTEGSSSFDDTFSGDDDREAISDAEVESQLPNFDFTPSILGGSGDLGMTMRKKNLTPDWRKFVRPLSWRVKWAELQVHRLESQQSKYHKELTKDGDRKEFETAMFSSDTCLTDTCRIKQIPVSGETMGNLVRRKKRKRVEDEFDNTSYMSQHPIFSYFGKTKSVVGRPSPGDFCPSETIVNGTAGFKFDDGWSKSRTTSNDNTLKEVLWKIEVAKSRFCDLRTRVNKLVTEYSGKFSCAVVKPCDAATTSYGNIAFTKNGDSKQARSVHTSAQHVTDYPSGNNIKSEAAVPSQGNASFHQSTFERTNQLHIGGSSKITENKSLTGQTAKLCINNSWSSGIPDNERAITGANSFVGLVPKRQRKKRHKRIF